ncbi:MAG: Uncharacterized protein XD78_1116 [Desulfotomaculum sp. 46_296]|nr:MAG: Uncharacterized protein XD78_1116 [Desulfotomaculum sp. 46_296]HAU30944.1 hypothetical protein [Desulfotomaculum sp.]
MKRLAAFLAVSVLILFCLGLAGCGGKKDAAEQLAPAGKEEPVAGLFAKGQRIEGMAYDYILTAPGAKMTGKAWVQGKKLRTEGVVGGQKIVTIIDGDANIVYSYYPSQNMAVMVSVGDMGKETQTPADYTKGVDPNAVKVAGTMVCDGAKCKVILVQGEGGSGEVRMWVREDYGIPVRVETTAPDGTKVVMEYKNVKIEPQSPELFKLPAGVKITDVNAMMKQLPQVPRR